MFLEFFRFFAPVFFIPIVIPYRNEKKKLITKNLLKLSPFLEKYNATNKLKIEFSPIIFIINSILMSICYQQAIIVAATQLIKVIPQRIVQAASCEHASIAIFIHLSKDPPPNPCLWKFTIRNSIVFNF